VHAIRRLERKAETPLSGFLFMAPSTQFKLCDSEVDPLLFVPLGDDRFYLVHKWGNDLDRARAILNWPFRSAIHLATMVVLVGIVLAMLVPTSLISMDPQAGFWGAHRIIMMFWTVMVCASFTVFGWFAFFGQFSTEAWNSRYFNRSGPLLGTELGCRSLSGIRHRQALRNHCFNASRLVGTSRLKALRISLRKVGASALLILSNTSW